MMKKLSLLAGLLLISSVIVFGQDEKNKKEEMQFDETSYDFGTMAYATEATHVFKFQNTTKQAIALTNVKSSCGCTVPSWSKEPIQPGHYGSVSVQYNTKIPGNFNKTIQVFSSAKNSPVRLSIRGEVTPMVKDGKTGHTGDANAENEHIKTLDSQNGKTTFPQTKGAVKRANAAMAEKKLNEKKK